MTPTRVAVIGGNGLLGQHVARVFAAESNAILQLSDIHPDPFVPLAPSATYLPLDFTDRAATKATLAAFAPDIVVNCAAYNDVDGAETERELAWRLNVKGVEHLVDACRKTDSRLIHVSSDYVFDGRHGPYHEGDTPNPISYYGKTKLAGENVCRTGGIRFTIIRTMVLYGIGEGVRDNFVTWVLRNLERGASFNVVDDQIGNPTFIDDLALGVLRIVERRREGVYNIAGPDIISRHAFALAIAKAFGFDTDGIHRITTAELHQRAARPLCSGFLTLRAQTELGLRMSSAAEGLQTMRLQIEKAHAH